MFSIYWGRNDFIRNAHLLYHSICLCFVFRSMWSIIYFPRKQAVMIYCKLYTAFANIRPATREYILQTSENELDPHDRFEYWINVLRIWWLKQYVLNYEFLLRWNWLGYISGTKHSFSPGNNMILFSNKSILSFLISIVDPMLHHLANNVNIKHDICHACGQYDL